MKYTAISDTSVTISWEAPQLNGELVNYHINGGPAEHVTQSLTYTISDLSKDKYYLISVAAQSTGGMGPSTTIGPIFSTKSMLVF